MPKINFKASAYYEKIDWKGDYTEPPLTKRIGDDDTATYIQTGDLPKLTSVNLASHMFNEYTLPLTSSRTSCEAGVRSNSTGIW